MIGTEDSSMTTPAPKWLTYEQCGKRTLYLRDFYHGLVFPAEPTAHEKLLADPITIYANLLSLADRWHSQDPAWSDTQPAQLQTKVYGPTERIPFRCLPAFCLIRYYDLYDDDWWPVERIWIDGGMVRVPEWPHEIYLASLFGSGFFPEHELLTETKDLLPSKQLDMYRDWCRNYVTVARRPNAEIRDECNTLLELMDIDDETAAVQAELVGYKLEPGDWEQAVALHRKYLAWCKAIVNDGWDLFALNSSDFVGNEERL